MTSSQAARWNRNVGVRVGRQHRTPTATRRASRRTGNAVTQSRYRRATQVVPKRDRARGSGSRSLSTQSGVDTAFDRVLDSLTTDWQNTADQQAVTTRAVEGAQEDPESSGFLDSIMDKIGNSAVGGLAGDVLGGVMNSPVGTALYNAGRLPNALFQGMEDLAKNDRNASQERGFLEEGGHIWNTLLGGMAKGWGYEEGASGFGQVYEAAKENPTSLVSQPLQAFEEAHPALEQALAIGVGAGGELGLDPFNVVAPALPSILRSTGQRLTREGLTEAVQAAGRQAISDGLAATPATFNRSPLAPDMIASRAEAALDDTLLNTVLDVRGGGAPHARSLGGDAFPSLVRERWLQSVVDSISGDADQAVQRLMNEPQRMTVANINARRAASKDFDDFWTKLTTDMHTNGLSPGTSVDEIIAVLKGNASTLKNPKTVIGGMIADNWETIRNEHFVQLQPHADQVYKAVENPTTRTLGLRVGKKVVPVPVVGRAFAFAGDTLGQLPGVKGVGSFLYEKQFPGLFANKISRASAYGVRGLDNFVRDLEKMAKGFTPEEAKDLFRAMGDSTFDFGGARAASGASMDDALDSLRKMREERFVEELREGARSIDDATGKPLPGKQFDPNYQYLHLKGGTKNKRLQFNKERADQFKDHGNYIGYGIEDAKKWGLRPIDDAFQAMQLHYMDSANKITKAYFWHDIAANYGLLPNATATGISNTEMTARGLRAVEYSKLSAAFKQATKDSGGKFYIPNEMHDLAVEFDKMMDWTTAKMGRFGRTFNKIINQFKLWTTLPYPGFHVRNFMGDTAMGLLDGVPPHKYLSVMKKYAASRAGRAANFEILPGYTMSFKQLMQQFRLEANSSYLKIDVGMTTTKTAGKIAGIGRSIGKKARNISDDRELLPRFTHWTEALQQEAKALWNSGIRDVDVIMQRSKDAALWRVNHYKFDYNALLPWERNVKAMAFPFYTYTRKAIPTLLEQMFINPHYFQMTNRWMMDNDGSAADAFNYMNMPQFWRDFGYGMITDEAEPLAMTGEILPTNVLDILSSNSLGEAARDLISTSNPAFQIPYELASGNRAFDDQEIQGGAFDYAMSKIPFVGDIQEQFSNILPGGSTAPVMEGDDWTRFLRNRLLGAGIPIRRASEGEQERQAEANFDVAADEPVTEYNYSQDRFSIQMRPGGFFQVTDKYEDNKPIGPMFPTPQAAIEWAMGTLPAPKHENVPLVNRPPNIQDIMKVLQSQ